MNKLILLHGALGSSSQLKNLADNLSKDFEVYSFDFSGHGSKSKTECDFSIRLFADELDRFIIDNEINNPFIFGYSMGGYVAIYHQLEYNTKIKAIFTLATKFDWTAENAAKEVRLMDADIIMQKVPKFADELKSVHGVRWTNVISKTAAFMTELGYNPLLKSDNLIQLQIPLLVAVGDRDNMVTIDETLNVHKLVTNSHLHVFSNMIHPINKVNTDRLANEVKLYFSKFNT